MWFGVEQNDISKSFTDILTFPTFSDVILPCFCSANASRKVAKIAVC